MAVSAAGEQADLSRLRSSMLLVALALYGVFGTPTPDRMGPPEYIIALLLILAVGMEGVLRPFGFGKKLPSALTSGQALLFYGLLCPVVVGALQGNGLTAILRDLIPFLFFLMPLFLGSLQEKPGFAESLSRLAVWAGLCFALRDLARIAANLVGLEFLNPVAADPLSYLANAPTVLFAALFLTGTAGRLIWQGYRLRDFLLAGLFLVLALVPFMAMAFSLQRASIGLAALVSVVWLLAAFVKYPSRALRLLVPVALVLLAFLPFLEVLGEALMVKTQSVGLNSRLEEIGAIWREVSAQPLTLLFGLGWGASFSSPAVGGLSVNFAHSLPAAMLLKTGLAGMILSGLYLAGFIPSFLRLMRRDSILALSLAAPLLIDSLLYAAYKSFDFGVILLLLWVAAFLPDEKEIPPQNTAAQI